MNYVDKCRVLLVGDPGVGKTSLANLLSQNESTRGSKWTVGCNVDIKLHTHKKTNKQYFIEFIDVAGSCKHRKSRQLFYKNLDGIILVYDLLNSKSHSNLWKWCTEVLNSEYMTKASNSKNYIDLKIGTTESLIPILVVGTKLDLTLASKDNNYYRLKKSSVAEEFQCNSVILSTITLMDPQVTEQFENFFNLVIEKRFNQQQQLLQQQHQPQGNNYLSSPSQKSLKSQGSFNSLSNRNSRISISSSIPDNYIVGSNHGGSYVSN